MLIESPVSADFFQAQTSDFIVQLTGAGVAVKMAEAQP